jgi:hypothetical protein
MCWYEVCSKVPFGRLSERADALPPGLAKAELYLILASVVRRFEIMELFGTTRRDVDSMHDFFIPFPALDTKGARVMIK